MESWVCRRVRPRYAELSHVANIVEIGSGCPVRFAEPVVQPPSGVRKVMECARPRALLVARRLPKSGRGRPQSKTQAEVRKVVECARPRALLVARGLPKSGRGRPQSKTQAESVRLWSAPALGRF